MDIRPGIALTPFSFTRALPRARHLFTALIAFLVLVGTAHSQAPGDAGGDLDADLAEQVRQLAQNLTPTGVAGAPRFEVSVGRLNPRLRLAPCERIEPYLPVGTRLWGNSRIGLRCAQGSVKWNVYLPITVKAFGTGLVAASGVAGGSVLTAADLISAEVDLAEDAAAPVADPNLAVGRTLTRSLRPGQSLRESHLKARQWFAAGDTVTVLAQGEGFSVAGEARALTNGIEGQTVRVRTESGRVLSGQPVGERRVEMNL
ncbi:MAG: flagellar basal body P-ring formation chaperone FlgA [Burkholderiaceae bacterium]